MTETCPYCRGTGCAPDILDRVKAECFAKGIPILPGDRITESNLCRLAGYGRDAIRKQIDMGKLILTDIKMRGNQRTFSLAEIAEKDFI